MNKIITENLRGFEIHFKTRPGIFSQQGVDEGSRLLINSIQVKDGTVICDLGCGNGVIGFIAAKLNPYGHIHLLDDSLRATTLAQENADENKFKNVEVYLSDLFSAVSDRTYHQIFSNPAQDKGNDFLEEMALECFKHLKSGGQVVWVVQSHIKPVVERLFDKYFKNYEVVRHGKIHVVIKAQKRS